MSLTISQVYSVRFGAKLPLPRIVQDNIAKLRITPVLYKPFRPAKPTFKPTRHEPSIENWRMKSITKYVSKIKDDNTDADYSEIVAIFNKLSAQRFQDLVNRAIEILRKRDEEFRLRTCTLLFNKAITESIFASLMADCALSICNAIPDAREDLHLQLLMFPKLYSVGDTLVYPSSNEEGFEDRVATWMSQKNKRRGYAKFVTQLFTRDLIEEEFISNTINSVFEDLSESGRQQKSEATEENTTQYVDFLYETSRILPKTARTLNGILQEGVQSILGCPRLDFPSLCMRSRFRLEDILKCVQ
jgi:hypothetical protein